MRRRQLAEWRQIANSFCTSVYLAKVLLTGHSGLLPLPVDRYGHCNFNTNELLTAFALAVR